VSPRADEEAAPGRADPLRFRMRDVMLLGSVADAGRSEGRVLGFPLLAGLVRDLFPDGPLATEVLVVARLETGFLPAGRLALGRLAIDFLSVGCELAGFLPTGRLALGRLATGFLSVGCELAGCVPAGRLALVRLATGFLSVGCGVAGCVPAGRLATGRLATGRLAVGFLSVGCEVAGCVPVFRLAADFLATGCLAVVFLRMDLRLAGRVVVGVVLEDGGVVVFPLGDVAPRFRADLLSGLLEDLGSRLDGFRSTDLAPGVVADGLIDRFEDDCLVAVGSDG